MAERTDSSQKLDRSEVASLLVELAEEFDSGEETVQVAVGNKTVSLTPAETVKTTVEVVERSPMFGGGEEKVDIELRWKR